MKIEKDLFGKILQKYLVSLLTLTLSISLAIISFLFFYPNDSSEHQQSGTTWDELNVSIQAIPSISDKSGKKMGRAEYESMRLLDPAIGKIPHGISYRENQFAQTLPSKKSLMQKSDRSISTYDWESRGPSNVGGRTRGLAIDITDRNRILAGGVTGGIWISEDWGGSWSKANHPNIMPDVTCLIQDTRIDQNDTWYFGTGELFGASMGVNNAYSSYNFQGVGIFKSTDRGVNWTHLESTASPASEFSTAFDVVNNIAINTSNVEDDEILAATYRTINRSTNGGESWEVVLGTFNNSRGVYPIDDLRSFSDITISSTGIMYAVIGSGCDDEGMWRSEDGVNWTNITPGDMPNDFQRTLFAISPSNETKVYVLSITPGSGYTASVDGGISMWSFTDIDGDIIWTNLTQNIPDFTAQAPNTYWGAAYATQNGYDMTIKVHPDDEDVVYLGGLSLFRSTSGFTDSESTQWIGGFNSGNQYGGNTVNVDNLNYPNHHGDLHNIVFDPVDPNIMFTSSDGGIHKTFNSLAPADDEHIFFWLPHEGYITSQFYWTSVDQANVGSLSIIGGMQDNSTYLSTGSDYLDPWMRISGGDGMATAIGAHPTEGLTSYYGSMQFGGFFAHLALDADMNLVSWNYITPPANFFLWLCPLKLDPSDWTTIYIADKNDIWRSTNHASSPNWETVPGVIVPQNGSISSIGVSYGGEHTLYFAHSVPFSNARPRIYRIDNALSETPVVENITSTDFNAGSFIHCLSVDPQDPNNVIAVFTNYGVRSLYYTDNGGESWRSIGGNLEENPDGTGNGPACYWAEIVRQGDSVLYMVGTTVGLYATNDITSDNITWLLEGEDTIGRLRVMGMDVRQSDGFVGVSTHGGGTFSTFMNLSDVEEKESELPEGTELHDAYPNPFNASTKIKYSLNNNSHVKISIYDINGRLVDTLVENQRNSGSHQVVWSPENISSGTYFYQLIVDGKRLATKKAIYVK